MFQLFQKVAANFFYLGIGLGSSDGVAATQDHNNHIRLLTDPSYFVVAMLHKQLKIIPRITPERIANMHTFTTC